MKLIRIICIILICVCLNGCAIWLADDNVQREVYYTTHYRVYHPAPYRPAPRPTHHPHHDVHQKPDGHQTHRPSGKPDKPGKPNQKPTVKPKPNQKPNNGNNLRPNGSVSSSPNRPRPKK